MDAEERIQICHRLVAGNMVTQRRQKGHTIDAVESEQNRTEQNFISPRYTYIQHGVRFANTYKNSFSYFPVESGVKITRFKAKVSDINSFRGIVSSCCTCRSQCVIDSSAALRVSSPVDHRLAVNGNSDRRVQVRGK